MVLKRLHVHVFSCGECVLPYYHHTAALPSVHDARIRFDGLYHFRIGVRRPGGVVVQALSLPSCLAHDGVRWEPESSKNACVCPRQSASNYLPWDLLVMNELAFFLLVAPTDELVYLQLRVSLV